MCLFLIKNYIYDLDWLISESCWGNEEDVFIITSTNFISRGQGPISFLGNISLSGQTRVKVDNLDLTVTQRSTVSNWLGPLKYIVFWQFPLVSYSTVQFYKQIPQGTWWWRGKGKQKCCVPLKWVNPMCKRIQISWRNRKRIGWINQNYFSISLCLFF